MFGWISDRFASAGEPAAALSSPRAARTLIARLETESPQFALDELARRYQAAPREALRTQNGARALGELDEWAQTALATLWESLLADAQGHGVREAPWGTLVRYYRRASQAYWSCVDTEQGTGPQHEIAEAPLAAARAMSAFGRYLLLQHMRYLGAAEDSWIALWRLHAWAKKAGVHGKALATYAGAAPTTIEQEFLVALLTEVAPTANLLPGQILALDQVLRLYASHYRIADRPDPQATPFSYLPGRDEPPQRQLPGMRSPAGARFFGPGKAYAELCGARDEAKRACASPAWLCATGCGPDAFAELLERLVAEWSADPPRRRHRREPCGGSIAIAHDLPTIRRLIKFSELALAGQSLKYDAGNIYKMKDTLHSGSDALLRSSRAGQPSIGADEALANLLSFEQSLEPGATETWQVNDSSESGLGVIAAAGCTWMKVGMAVAFRHCDRVEWQLAIVRRLSRSARGELLVGMARLGDNVRSARLRRGIAALDYGRASNPGGAEIEYDAISLRQTRAALLLPVGVFDNTEKYTLTCEDRQRIVKMERSLERRPNFECIEISEVELLRAA